jgi:uncharacterized membrane protein (UPF0127 family)
VRRVRCLLLLAAALPLLSACRGDRAVAQAPPAPSTTPAPAARSTPGPRTAVVRVGRAAPVQAEVASTRAARATGLMGRTDVPVGTGMVFRYDAPSSSDYWMYTVPVPLTAVFALHGRVVDVVEMAPCVTSTPAQCPTYGPGTPYDTVLETAPETLRGRVAAGDHLTVTAAS